LISSRLFHSVKDDIYKGAASVISKFEKEPYFLLQLFRGVSQMEDGYYRQRLLLAIDDIMTEKQDLEAA
jgi:hypothetical protein